MLFSSLTFLFGFLPILLAIYYVIPKKYEKIRNLLLLIFSLLFYAWGEPANIILMLLTISVSYASGILLEHFKNYKKVRRGIFILSVMAILGSLIYFKYTNFILGDLARLTGKRFTLREIVLPIGISFYTFQILSYIIDLYREKIEVQRSWIDLALYISFFPQLIAGPIVTYSSIKDQLHKRNESLEKVIAGVKRFIVGLGKKVIIANQMAILADAFFDSTALREYSLLVIVVATLAYTFQIYFDFSGYSDMAIGLGKMFGFEFLENFNYPYVSSSIGEFWKRWHISLTSFFREYVYIPLGGNRVKKWRWLLNMTVVWLLTGLWHGAAFNFILWGIYYLVLLLLERTLLRKMLPKIPKVIRFIMTFGIINVGWIIFRVNRLRDLYYIFTFKSNISLVNFIDIDPDVILPLIMLPVAFVLSLDLVHKFDVKYRDKRVYNCLKNIVLVAILVVSIGLLASSMYNPFIYFRF